MMWIFDKHCIRYSGELVALLYILMSATLSNSTLLDTDLLSVVLSGIVLLSMVSLGNDGLYA